MGLWQAENGNPGALQDFPPNAANQKITIAQSAQYRKKRQYSGDVKMAFAMKTYKPDVTFREKRATEQRIKNAHSKSGHFDSNRTRCGMVWVTGIEPATS